jgi:hypothetical protein
MIGEPKPDMGGSKASEDETKLLIKKYFEDAPQIELLAKKLLEDFTVFEIGALAEGVQRTMYVIKDRRADGEKPTHEKEISALYEKMFKVYQAARKIKK